MRFTRLQSVVLALGFLTMAGFVANLTAPVARAQADLGSVIGIVTDATGAVVPDAQIKVTNPETGAIRNAVSNSRGEYAVTQLLPASYSLTVTAPGFASAKQKVSVTVGSQNTVNVKLAVAGGTTQVIVAADDFAGVQLEKPEVSSVLETNQILSLPTLDRNPYNLVQFSGNLSSDSTATVRGVGFNISGSRSTSVDILLDGAENTDMYALGIGQSVPMDATSEIRIVTSNSGAEYGRGAGAVNVSTKSGTNEFHGSGYEFNRISTLASDGFQNNYIHFMDPSQPSKPRYTHNQFGYSVGGPIKKNKIFFFSSTEWTRVRSAQNIVTTVPTSSSTTGNTGGLIGMSASNMQSFFSTYGKLSHPINGTTYTGASTAVTKIFGGDVLSIADSEMGVTPGLKTSPTDCTDSRIAAAPICTTQLFGQAIYSYPGDSGGGAPVNQWITFNRADFTFNQTTSMFVRYIQEGAVNPAGYINNSPYTGYDTPQTQYNHGIEVSISKAFTSNLASATKLLGSRFNQGQPLAGAPVSPTLYVNGSNPVTLGGGYINFPGYSQTSPGNALPFGGPQNFIQVGEDLAWSKGKHQFTFGGDVLNIKDNRTFGAYEEAVDGLNQSGNAGALSNFISGGLGLLQVAIDPQGKYPCYRNAAGAYQVTAACTLQLPVSSPNFSRANNYLDGAAYANDSWKVSPKFTVNLGVRWEIYGPQHSQKPAYDANFYPDYTQTNPWDQIRNGQVFTRNNAPGGRLWNLNKKQFAPKVGFAWDPTGDGKTSIRGGYGMSYERNFGNVTFNVIQNPPNYAVVSFVSSDNAGALIPISTNNFAQFGSGTGSKYLPNVTLRAVDPRIKPSYAQNWSLSFERQIASSTASVSYVGTRGIHNYSIANINRSFDGSTFEGDARAANRTNYQYGNINWRGADGDSYYHGITAELRSADLAHTGLNVRADYTWSHSIDNTSSAFSDSGNEAGGGLVLGYTDPWDTRLDRGSSDFDQRQRGIVTVVWQIPFAKNTTGLSKMLLDNWTLSDTFDAQTGTPFTEFDCGQINLVCPRASFVSDPPRKKSHGMKDLSSVYGPNTFSYISLPTYYDAGNNPTDIYYDQSGNYVDGLNYNEQINPLSDTTDVPICTGIHNAGCHFVPGMDPRNAFHGPGSWHENLGIVKDFKVHDRYAVQIKGEFINVLNHANTYLNLSGANDVSSYTDVLAYKGGLGTNRNTELSVHLEF
jgi:hypothetical protein